MSFGMNVQALRRRRNMTQEDLADALGVSRQSVSKWESDGSFPEMEKLVQLCELFGCDLDTLVRGSMESSAAQSEQSEQARAEQAMGNAYDAHMRAFGRAITGGVGLVLFGVALLLLIFSRNPIDSMAIAGTAVLLGCVAVAATLFVYYGCAHAAFQKRYPAIEVSPYSAEETERADRRFPLFIAGGVGLVLLDVVFLVCCPLLYPASFETDAGSSFATGIFMLILSIAAMLLVYGGMTKMRYNVSDYNRETAAEEAAKQGGDWAGAIMLTATAAFLLMGFVWNLWHPGWVVFPIGGILCGIVGSIRGEKKS